MKRAAFYGWIVVGLVLGISACADAVNPMEVRTHPEDWANPAVHGQMVLESASKAENCASCHGDDYEGGTSGVSCAASGCHGSYPHPTGFADVQAEGFHAAFVAERVGWDVTTCQGCHGADYAGAGDARKDCTTCHTQPAGPEACNTCHGGPHGAAPPSDLEGHTETTFAGVGAHQAHLDPGATVSAVACADCHAAVSSFTSPHHLDEGAPDGAEVVFSALATQDGRQAPAYDAATGTCSNVYCHGAFAFDREGSRNAWGYADAAITGNSMPVRWTAADGTEATCGSCHGLPPTGHRLSDNRVPIIEQCSTCHPSVIDDAAGKLDTALHINGKIDIAWNGVLGKTAPFPFR